MKSKAMNVKRVFTAVETFPDICLRGKEAKVQLKKKIAIRETDDEKKCRIASNVRNIVREECSFFNFPEKKLRKCITASNVGI